MNTSDLREWLERSRRKTLELLDSIEKLPDPAAAPARHEAHHHEQTHLTFNLYRAAHGGS